MYNWLHMRVLLVSPLDPKTPGNLKFLVGGENTYSRNLLDFPPRGVQYIHHEEALKSGKVAWYAYEGEDLVNTPLAKIENAIGIKAFG